MVILDFVSADRRPVSPVRHRAALFCMVSLLVLSWPSSAAAQSTFAADALVDSAGVNVHLHYDNTAYRDRFPLIQSRLVDLGVRHVRDGLIYTAWQEYYERHNSLGRLGIKGVFITSPGLPDAVLKNYPALMRDSFEAYEAPNEYNLSGDPNWPTTMRTVLAQLHSLRNDPSLAGFPVFGPSLTDENAYRQLGDVSALIDAGNLHNYFAGRNPGTGGWGDNGYGSIDWNLQVVGRSAVGKPIVTTETGYWDDPARVAAVPQEVSGKYMPRLLLEQFLRGIRRTYIYELCDIPGSVMPGESGYGLLRSDGSPKPAYHAVQGLLSLLRDPGPSFTVRPLPYSVAGGSSDVRHVAFQKRDGTYYLALWIEQSGFDLHSRNDIVVPPQPIMVHVPSAFTALNTYRWNADGTVERTANSGETGWLPVSITDRLMMIELRDQSLSQTLPALAAPTALRIAPLR
jgi:hypothetical protein